MAHGRVERIAQRRIGAALAKSKSDIRYFFRRRSEVWRDDGLIHTRICGNGRLDASQHRHQRASVGVAVAAGEFGQKPAAALGGGDRRVNRIIFRFLRRLGYNAE
ncbi:MAG TPA: hypothetical protein VHX43_06750 [Xanthobacteraceae bacterium]|nr:hypothetical protein [Xanthobacteraceae bacterium]